MPEKSTHTPKTHSQSPRLGENSSKQQQKQQQKHFYTYGTISGHSPKFSHLSVGRMGILLGLGNGVFIIHAVIVTFVILCDVVVVYVCHVLHHIHSVW